MMLGHCGALGQLSDPGRGPGPCCSLQPVVPAICVHVGGVLVWVSGHAFGEQQTRGPGYSQPISNPSSVILDEWLISLGLCFLIKVLGGIMRSIC